MTNKLTTQRSLFNWIEFDTHFPKKKVFEFKKILFFFTEPQDS